MTQATCDLTEPLLQGYRDGELSIEESHQVEAHLAECAVCRGLDGELDVLTAHLRDMHKAVAEEPVQVSIPGIPAVDTNVQAAVAAFANGKSRSTPEPSGIGVAARRIGGYEIEREIARGGMGRVYRAIQVSMDRPVALKVLAPHLSENEKYVARFLREARVAATIAHPNLVAIYDVGQDGEQLYYSMELVEGDDLEVRLRQGALPQREVATIGLGVARALEAAAQASVIHRDIKPANILLTSEGGIKLADLGLAKNIDNKDSSLTVSKTIIGSPNYMSPEQAEDLRSATHRSDIYMLGATLLHLVSGELPFGRGSPIEILARVLRDPPSLPDVVSGEAFDPQLRAIISRCLQKTPEARYADASELLEDLEGYLSGAKQPHLTRPKSKRIRRSARLRRSGSSDGRVRVDSGMNNVNKKRQIPPAFWVAAAALVLGAIALGIVGGSSNGDDSGEDPVEVVQAPKAPKSPLVSDQTPEEIVDGIVGDDDVDASTPDSDESRGPRDSTQDDEAEVQLASLVRFRDQNPDLLGETYRRARDLASDHPDSESVEKAKRIAYDAQTRLQELLDEAAEKAERLEKDGRLWEAQEQYAAYLGDYGEDVPGASQALLGRRSLQNQIDTSVAGDLDKVDELLAAGNADGADAVLANIGRYAGKARMSKAREALEPALLAARRKDPPDNAGDALAAKRLEGAQQILAMAHESLKGGDVPAAQRGLARLQREFGKDVELQNDIDGLRRAIDEARNPQADLGELLAAVLPGAKVEVVEGNRVSVGYGFSSPDELEDWREAGIPRNPQQKRMYDFVNRGRKAKYDPWTVQKGHLAAYGYSRRQLRASFSLEDPIEIEVEARGKQNLLVAFEGGGTTVAGFGYMLEQVRIAELMGGGFRRMGDGAKEYLERMNHSIANSRKRGPSMAVFREETLFQHQELMAKPIRLKRKTKFTAELRQGDDEDHQLVVLKAGKKLREAVDLEHRHRGPVSVTLLTLGALAAYDKVVVTGTLSEQFVNRMNKALRESKGLDGVREAFMKGERQRAKGDRDRRRDR